jgi:hypothetical protein
MIGLIPLILLLLVFIWGAFLFGAYSYATRGMTDNWDAVVLAICSFTVVLEYSLLSMFIAKAVGL